MNHPEPAHSPRCILRIHDVEKRVGLKKSHIYDMIRQGTFPASVSLGDRVVGWDSHKIDAWVNARLDAAPEGIPSEGAEKS